MWLGSATLGVFLELSLILLLREQCAAAYPTTVGKFLIVPRYLLRIFYTWSDTQIFVQKERRTSKWGLALEFQVSGLYPLCGSVPLSGISSHLKMALSSAHRMLFRTAGELLVR